MVEPASDARGRLFADWDDVLHQVRTECPADIAGLRRLLERFPAEQREDVLVDLACEHLTLSWKRSVGMRVEDYLTEFGKDHASFESPHSAPVELITAEFLARHANLHAEPLPDIGEYLRRFPDRDDVVEALESRSLDGGRYVLLRKQGRGGLGFVWLACDRQLRRHVAIKEPLPEFAGDSLALDRLAEEARVTAGLEHPAIVTVHESRAEGDGPPFYVMRLVGGRPMGELIAEYHARRSPLLFNRLIQAVATAADAVAYAHGRGVLHRDLKPANVMLGEFGETVVLDWGLAGIKNPAEAVLSGETADWSEGEAGDTPRESPTGTLAYMAPEQLDGKADAQTDVFGLGAVLYEVLTRRPPFHDPRVKEPLAMTVARVRECQPTPPRRLNPRAPRALEAVCLKAMSRQPAERYLLASEFAQEVRRFLADEPVTARREPLLSRAARWARRHRPLVAGAAALAAALIIALGVLAVVQERSKNRLQREQARSEAKYRQARAAVESLTEFSEKDLAGIPGTQAVRGKMLERVLNYYESFLEEHADDPTLTPELARACLRGSTLAHQLGNGPRAMALMERGLPLAERCAGENPDDVDLQILLLGAWANKANMLDDSGRVAEGLELQEKCIDHARRMLQWHVDHAELRQIIALGHGNAGVMARRIGRLDVAKRHYELAIELRGAIASESPKDPGLQDLLAGSHLNYGIMLRRAGNKTEGLKHLLKSREIRDAMIRDHPNHPQSAAFRVSLGSCQFQLARVKLADGDAAGALKEAKAALTLFEAGARANPDLAIIKYRMMTAIDLIASAHAAMEDQAATLAASNHCIGLARELIASDGASVDYQMQLAQSLGMSGNALRHLGKPDEAIAKFRESIEVFAILVEKNPDRESALNNLAVACFLTAQVYARPSEARESPKEVEARVRQAVPHYERSIDTRKQMIREFGEKDLALMSLAESEFYLASALRRLNEVEKALKLVDMVSERRRALVSKHAKDGGLRFALGEALRNRAELLPNPAAGAAYLEASREFAASLPLFKVGTPAHAEIVKAALDCLRSAAQINPTSAAQLGTDPALKPLRDLPEFQRLLQSIASPSKP